MKISSKGRKILIFSIWLAIIAGLIVILCCVNKIQNSITCTKVNIAIDTTNGVHFLSKEIVENIINPKGGTLVGKNYSEININYLEEVLRNLPWVSKANVYATISGEINFEISQRSPLFRVINLSNEEFYVDTEGHVMPMSPNYTARVLVANGMIYEPYISFRKIKKFKKDSLNISSCLTQLFILSKFIEKSEFWKAQIEQIYVNSDNEIELVPQLGNHVIIFGNILNMEEKFENLMIFYERVLKKVGWDNYSSINLKFKNQIVCLKNVTQK